jgi:hypothetical protein
VKAAYFVQYTQTADNFITFYAIGNRLMMLPKGLRWKVLSNAATITIIPLFANRSQNSTISGKNCP